jgi:all-trans-8'-apo-beta-carotenal 15,15'-oxygenase
VDAFAIAAIDIEGSIPKELTGTFVRNGPGLSVVHGERLVHPIDGDGLVASLSFEGGTATFQAAFVQTKQHEIERREKKMLFTGLMGSRPQSEDSRGEFRDPQHTNAFYAGNNKILALHEYALPTALEASSLATLGKDTLNGVLDLKALSAHWRVDVEKKRVVTVAFRPGILGKKSKITFYEFDYGMQLLQKTQLQLEGVDYVHDFLLTREFYLVHATPFIDLSDEMISSGKLPGEAMGYNPQHPSEMVLISRQEAGRRVIRAATDPCHIYHYGTCRVAENGNRIQFDACCLPAPGFNMRPDHGIFLSNSVEAPGRMWTYDFDVKKAQISRILCKNLETTACEFPTTNILAGMRGTRFFYLMASPAGQALPYSDVVKYDTQTHKVWRWTSGGVVGEPWFLPRKGATEEDDGWLIAQCYLHRKHQTQFVILEAKSLKLCARINLPFHLPYAFHGSFTDQVLNKLRPKI